MKGKKLTTKEVRELKPSDKEYFVALDTYGDHNDFFKLVKNRFKGRDTSFAQNCVGLDTNVIRVYEWIDEDTTKNLGGIVKMDKLKIELFRYENLVFGSTIYINDNLRGSGKLAEKDNFSIRSDNRQDFQENTLYVNGTDQSDNDNNMFMYQYNSVKEAIKTCVYIEGLVGQINEAEDESTISSVIRIL